MKIFCLIVKKIIGAVASILFSAALVSLIYVAAVFFGEYNLQPRYFAIAMWILAVIIFLLKLFERKKPAIAAIIILALMWVLPYFIYVKGLNSFKNTEVYNSPIVNRDVYNGKNIMVLVPHQDDEAIILGGIFEEYVRMGSEITVVYSTNGDYVVPAETRFSESIAYMERMGVKKENIIFMGYGDSWKGEHLYNAQPYEIKESSAGHRETYGTADITPFGGTKPYTRQNFHDDLKNIILEKRPEIIYCIDYDNHQDHKALSLMFEEVMGEILREEEYQPVIMKAFAYSTAWYGKRDYHDQYNVGATEKIYEEDFLWENSTYQWSERIRLPIRGDKLARYAANSALFEDLTVFTSQNATKKAESMFNSDKVFWERRSDSLLYSAEIEVSSGAAEKLNDFRLVDSIDVKGNQLPEDGCWRPDADDKEKKISAILAESSPLHSIVLYDDTSLENNILSIEIVLDDGSVIETGPLVPNGSATEISLDGQLTSSFTVEIKEWEGSQPGLTEIEAFSDEKEENFPMIKIMDAQENFIYDYLTAEKKQKLKIYTRGIESYSDEDFAISCNNSKCSAVMENGEIKLDCPKGEECFINIKHIPSGEEDRIRVYCMKTAERIWYDISRKSYDSYSKAHYEQLMRAGKTPYDGPLEIFMAVAILNYMNL